MNLIFLDIDGVLNNLGTVAAYGNPSKYFDPVSVKLIDKLCREGDASIVMSTSWRCGEIKKLCYQMNEAGAGVLVQWIISETPDLPGMRGTEIAKALEGFPRCERYVIIDDDSDMLPDQPFVQTTFEDGFRFRHYIEALGHLNPEHEDVTRRIIPVTDHDEQGTS